MAHPFHIHTAQKVLGIVVAGALLVILGAIYLPAAFAAAGETVKAPAAPTASYLTTSQNSSALPNAVIPSNIPPDGYVPGSGSKVQSTFDGINVQGTIFNQKPGETSAEASPVQIYDYLNVWGGLNVPGKIFNTNGALVIEDENLQVNGTLTANGTTIAGKDLTVKGGIMLGTNAWLNDNNGDEWIRLSLPTDILNYTHGLAGKNLWANEHAFIQQNLRVNGVLYNANNTTTVDDNLKITGNAQIGAGGHLTWDPANSWLRVGKTSTGYDGKGIAANGFWANQDIQVGGALYSSSSSEVKVNDSLDVSGNIYTNGGNPVTVADSLRVENNIQIGKEGYLTWDPTYNWLHVGSTSTGYDGKGLAANNVWTKENVQVGGYLYNNNANEPLLVKDDLDVQGNIYNTTSGAPVIVDDQLKILGGEINLVASASSGGKGNWKIATGNSSGTPPIYGDSDLYFSNSGVGGTQGNKMTLTAGGDLEVKGAVKGSSISANTLSAISVDALNVNSAIITGTAIGKFYTRSCSDSENTGSCRRSTGTNSGGDQYWIARAMCATGDEVVGCGASNLRGYTLTESGVPVNAGTYSGLGQGCRATVNDYAGTSLGSNLTSYSYCFSPDG